MKKILKDLILSTFFVTTVLSSSALGKNEYYRIHPSLGYHQNTQVLNGTDEKYDPLRISLGFEFDYDLWGFNKFKVAPFLGEFQGDYDAGIDFKLKKIFEKKEISPYFYLGMGAIYMARNFEEHKYKLNFNLNAGVGLEYKLSENSALTFAVDLDHISMGKKIWNSLYYRTMHANNSGNPGFNTLGFVIGWIYRLKKD